MRKLLNLPYLTQLFLAGFCLTGLAFSAQADNNAIINKLKKLGATQVDVKNSPVQGIKMAVTEDGPLYVTEDGKYAFQGKLYELTDKGPVDVGVKALMPTLESYKNEMIVLPAKNEKYVVTVFMDITCHYCHKLYQESKQYNDLGITLRFLAFPRAGLNSQPAQQMEAIYTAKDPAFALQQAENGELPKTLKTANVVKKHYELGVQFGVRGTPTIITPQGEVIGGYLPAKELLAALQGQ